MSKSGLLARQKAERELWTIKVIAYTEQQTLDAVCLALAEGFGFGEERLKRFHDAFNAKYAEIRELEKGDTKDNEYAIAKQEAALKAACGKLCEFRSRIQRRSWSSILLFWKFEPSEHVSPGQHRQRGCPQKHPQGLPSGFCKP